MNKIQVYSSRGERGYGKNLGHLRKKFNYYSKYKKKAKNYSIFTKYFANLLFFVWGKKSWKVKNMAKKYQNLVKTNNIICNIEDNCSLKWKKFCQLWPHWGKNLNNLTVEAEEKITQTWKICTSAFCIFLFKTRKKDFS